MLSSVPSTALSVNFTVTSPVPLFITTLVTVVAFEKMVSPFAEDIDWSICDPKLKNLFTDLKDSFIATTKDINGLSVKQWLDREDSNNFTI